MDEQDYKKNYDEYMKKVRGDGFFQPELAAPKLDKPEKKKSIWVTIIWIILLIPVVIVAVPVIFCFIVITFGSIFGMFLSLVSASPETIGSQITPNFINAVKFASTFGLIGILVLFIAKDSRR